jgi:hypothetical protein
MRNLSLTQLLSTTAAFTLVSAGTADAALLLADRTGTLDVAGEWYINAPLGVWALAGIPVTIALAERLLHQINPKPRRITAFAEDEASPVIRAIGLTVNGRRNTLLASVSPFFVGNRLPQQESPNVHRPVAWRVPVNNNEVIVRESELRAFLDIAFKRTKHQFSRSYWLKTRRPPLYRAKYDAFMRLLVESGLVEGRHTHGRASGRLVTQPRHAITYLKYESAFRVV